MFTRCPGCQCVYELDAELLAEAAGIVRCGHCGKTFNSLAELFNRRPDERDSPIVGGGMPPLLEQPDFVQPELPGVNLFDQTPTGNEDAEPSEVQFQPVDHRQPLWVACSVLLTLALVGQLAWQHRSPDSWLHSLGFGAAGLQAGSDPADAIQVLTRDLHRHPTLDDAVIVSVTLRNSSERPLRWPTLEVRLYDPSQQVIGLRRLPPADYLGASTGGREAMPSDLLVPVIVELVVGETMPSGFDFRFL